MVLSVLAVVFSKPVIAALGLAAGFGAGRVKNASKLKAIDAELKKVTGPVESEIGKLVLAIKSKL
jgi:hypothetical protein